MNEVNRICCFIFLNCIILAGCHSEPDTNNQLIIRLSNKTDAEILEACNSMFDCYTEETIALLNDKHRVKHVFGVTEIEATIISQGKHSTASKEKKGQLTYKLSHMVSDTTSLKKCTGGDRCFVHLVTGDVALVGIYRITPFPFAEALQIHHCSGLQFAPDIRLPKTISDYTSFGRSHIKRSLQYYLQNQSN